MLDQEPSFPEPVLPEPGAVLAAVMQHVGDRQRELQIAEAARIVALLEAYRVTMEDAEIAGEPTSRDRYVAKGFLVAAGTVLRMSQRGAAHLLDTASAVRGSLPRSWEVFLAGECSWRLLDLTHQQADGLEGEPRRRFDEAAALLLSTLSAPDLKQRLHRLRERLDPGAAPERAARAARSRHSTIQPLPDGQAAWTLIGPAHVLAAIEDGVHQQAVALHGLPGEDRCFGALRFDVATDILLQGLCQDAGPGAGEPARKAVTPTVILTIPALTLLGLGDECPNLAGYGPIDIETAKRLAGDADSWTRVFTDPITGDLAAVDAEARRIPQVLKRWLIVRDETCRAPGCGRPANRCDIDHVRRYEHGGPTSPDNLVCLCRGHHAVKDDGCWTVTLLPGGRMEWRSRWGTVRTTEPAVRARI
ncbi:MAG TPA: DUF222 domain-containing protein [Amnibacterium sp.]|jgi:hypothetical protein|uniref:HNH endonuclease signature motif containing protein n=1 Tax=Amnibacterium sp. TaxID=1872496 RepID=UPI002F91F3BA